MIEEAVDKDYDQGRSGIVMSSIEGTEEFASVPRGRLLRGSAFDFSGGGALYQRQQKYPDDKNALPLSAQYAAGRLGRNAIYSEARPSGDKQPGCCLGMRFP